MTGTSIIDRVWILGKADGGGGGGRQSQKGINEQNDWKQTMIEARGRCR